MENTWRNEKIKTEVLNNKLTEASINRIMKHASEEGIVIISTARSVVVPSDEDGNYDFNSWQSLFDDYVKFCYNEHLDICEQNITGSMDINSIIDIIKEKGYTLNKKSSEKYLNQRNKYCDKDLYTYLKSKANPYNFTATYGGFMGLNGEIADYEPSFIIYNNLNKSKTSKFGNYGWGDLYKKALSMCKEYKQDAVYVQAPGESPIYVDKDGNKVNSTESLDFSFNSNDSFFTTTKRKKSTIGKVDNNASKRGVNPHTFTADISFEEIAESMSIRPKTPNSNLDALRIRNLGEICSWNLEYSDF